MKPLLTEKEGWKVFYIPYHLTLRSVWGAPIIDGDGVVLGRKLYHYTTEEWCRPPEGAGPFAVFETEAQAHQWLSATHRCYGDFVVRKVRYVPSDAAELWGAAHPDAKNHGISAEGLPPGTVLADAVYILRGDA